MKTKLKVSIKDANAAEKDGVELYQEMQCCIASSDMGRCKARAADMCTITNTFQPQDVGQREPLKKLRGRRRYVDDINYLGRKELGVALPELRDLFMRRVDFSGGAAQLVHWATS